MLTSFLAWLDARFPLFSTWKKYVSEYYVPKNLNLYYCFGILALVILGNQLVTGLWLTMFYTPSMTAAFDSIQTIMRDVNYGWLLRYMHSTGASFFFIILYIHVFRSLLYGSYQKPRELVWLIGVGLLVILQLEAFFGYLLPWGQMSYWGAQVITALLGVIPWVGETLTIWLRGDYAVGNATLMRFFALHVIGLPLIVIGLVYVHIVALHHVGSNNPQGIDINQHLDSRGKPVDGIPFHPYYTFKDSMAVLIFLCIFFAIVFFVPEGGGYFIDSLNYAPANSLSTPEQIRPMWYMAPFYSMLRAIPHKGAGCFLMISAVWILFLLPWLDKSPVRAMRYKGYYSRIALWLWAISFILLGYWGMRELTPLTLWFTRLCIIFYFSYFLLMPLYTHYETYQTPPTRID